MHEHDISGFWRGLRSGGTGEKRTCRSRSRQPTNARRLIRWRCGSSSGLFIGVRLFMGCGFGRLAKSISATPAAAIRVQCLRPEAAQGGRIESPLHGVESQGWFLGVHCFHELRQSRFFRDASVRPIAPAASKRKNTRTLDIDEDDQLDEAQLAPWVKQASQFSGEGI
jgi:hypothetical protein